MLLRVSDLLVARFDVPNSPRCDYFQFGSKCFNRKLKTNLIVSLARAAVADSVCVFFLGDLDKSLCYRRTRKGRAKQITLVLSTRFKGGEDEVVYEFILYILYVELGSARFLCAVFKTDYLRILSDVSRNADDLNARIILFQPRNDNRCIKSARICQNYFFDFLSHDLVSPLKYFY